MGLLCWKDQQKIFVVLVLLILLVIVLLWNMLSIFCLDFKTVVKIFFVYSHFLFLSLILFFYSLAFNRRVCHCHCHCLCVTVSVSYTKIYLLVSLNLESTIFTWVQKPHLISPLFYIYSDLFPNRSFYIL